MKARSGVDRQIGLVSEIGLDGKAKVDQERQLATLRIALRVLQEQPRIVSLNSFSANDQMLDELKARPIRGAMLHWWLGSPDATRAAVDIGCYFSINASSVTKTDILSRIPIDRILPETDHPYGDRRSPKPQRPRNVASVEAKLAKHYGVKPDALRLTMWRNLATLVDGVGCGGSLPRRLRSHLAAVPI